MANADFSLFYGFCFLYVFCDESLVIWDEKPESNLRYLGRQNISGDRRTTVKREDGPCIEPPVALDLQSPEAVYSGDGALNCTITT